MSYSDTILFDYTKPEELLQNLIKFNTTNPPGNEAECIKYIYNVLKDAGIDANIVYKDSERLNLVARLKGQGLKPPLLMYGHIDVVAAEQQVWEYPPFDGVIADGCVWGRGALDMKGAISMMICALLRGKREGFVPAGDVILCVVSDEEDSGAFGAKYIVEQHRDLFKDVKYAIGEIGGFTMFIGGKRFYPIMVSEKQRCGIKATINGQGGHGSLPVKDGTMTKVATVLNKLNKERLPVHVTPSVKMMIDALSSNLPFVSGLMIKSLLNPLLTDKILNVMGNRGRVFDAILHNTVNATMVHGGNKINMIPSEVEIRLDGRLLPGINLENFIQEVQIIVGDDIKLEVLFYEKGPQKIDMSLFGKLGDIIKEKDKDGIPIPFVVSGVTDARFFSDIGIQTYGFTPMILPKDIDFSQLIHNANERIPVEALKFGTDSIYRLIKRY